MAEAAQVPAKEHYRPATAPERQCSTCRAYAAGVCTMFPGDPPVSPSYVCDGWEAPEPAHPPAQVGADHHNAVLEAARARVDELEPKLVAVLTPMLRRVGEEAARNFLRFATNHLTAAGPLTGVKPTSTMICLRPRQAEAEAIADPDGSAPSDLHVTLAYLGEIDGDLKPLLAVLAPVAGSHGPLAGVVGGYGEFQPPGCGILLPDVPGLVELRVAVTEALTQAGIDYGRDHGFTPHITVDGDPEDGEIDEMLERAAGNPLHFDSLLIVRGDAEMHELPLVGPRPLTADGSPLPPDWTPPAAGELVDADALVALFRGKTDPIRLALIQEVLGAAFGTPGMTAEEAIAYYHSPSAFGLNDALRTGKPLTVEQQSVVNALDAIMKPSEKDMVLWRGVPNAADVFGTSSASEIAGSTFQTSGYLSTSIDPEVAEQFAGGISGPGDVPVVQEIRVPKGTPMLEIPAGDFGDQAEWLLPRNIGIEVGEMTGGAAAEPPKASALASELAKINNEVRAGEDRRDYVPMAKDAFRQMEDGGYLANAQKVEVIGSWNDPGTPAPNDVDVLITVDGDLTAEQRAIMDAVTKTGGAAAHPFDPDFHAIFVSPTDPEYNEKFAERLRAGTERRYDLQPRVLGEAKPAVAAADEPFGVNTLRFESSAVDKGVLSASRAGVAEGAGLSFDVANPLIDGLIAQTGQHITSIVDTTRANVMRVVGSSYEAGLSIPDTAKAIRAVMTDAAPKRAIMIARTEMTSAVNGASLASANLIGKTLGTSMKKTWLTAPGAQYPRHEDYEGLDGQTVLATGKFQVGEDELQYPGDPGGSPEEVINCFPGSTLVVASHPSVGFRRRYVGSLVRVETDRGDVLAGTPNHPVLTRSGWQPLHLLREGDHVVCGLLREGAGVVDPDVDHAPAAIQEVVAALARLTVPHRVRGRAVQFHGDASADGEVEVVAPDRELRRNGLSALLYPAAEGRLVRADEVAGLLSPAGSSRQVGLATGAPSDRVMGGGREPLPLRRGGLPHPLAHRGGAVARLDPQFEESSTDHAPVDAVALGQGLLGDAFEVSLAQIVKVDVQAFHGDVFNLQTESGVYLASGIMAHNCRCAMTYSDGTEVDAE